MSLKHVFASIAHAVGIGSATAATTITGAAASSLHHLGTSLPGSVAAAAEQSSPIGSAAVQAIRAAEAAGGTGKAKLATAIAQVAPVVIAEAGKVGLKGVEAEAERFAEIVIEAVLPSIKQTPLYLLGQAILHEVGVA